MNILNKKNWLPQYCLSLNAKERVEKYMTIGHFCGLLQSDGTITFYLDDDLTINAKISFSQTYALEFMQGLLNWLKSLGIKAKLKQDVKNSDLTRRSVEAGNAPCLSVSITTQEDCLKLINLILKEEKKQNTILLFDRKRNDLFILKEVLRIAELKKKYTNTGFDKKKIEINLEKGKLEENLKLERVIKRKNFLLKKCWEKIIDLRLELSRDRVGPPMRSRETFETMANLNFNTSVGKSKGFINRLHKNTFEKGKMVFMQLEKNPKNYSSSFGEFVAGLFDGDGSFGHLISEKSKKQLQIGHPYNITPYILFTDQVYEEQTLFDIIQILFGKQNTFFSETKAAKLKSEKQKRNEFVECEKESFKSSSYLGGRVRIVNVTLLKEFVEPFFKKHPPLLDKQIERLNIMLTILHAHPIYAGKNSFYSSKETMLDVLKFIKETDLYSRKTPWAEFEAYVNSFYKKQDN